MKRVFAYNDYRTFLRDYYEEKKENNPFLLWYLGYHLRLEPEFLNMVIDKVEHLEDTSLRAIAKYFKFTRDEYRFFVLLVKYNKAKSIAFANRCIVELKKIRRHHIRLKKKTSTAHRKKKTRQTVFRTVLNDTPRARTTCFNDPVMSNYILADE